MKMLRSLVPLSSFVLFGLAASAHAQAGGSYTLSSGSGFFSSISGVGTPLSPSSEDDGSAEVLLPFTFSFFGNSYPSGSSLWVGVNGAINFDSSAVPLGNTSIPSSGAPNGIVAAFWQDLHLDTSGSLYTAVSGGTGSRIFTIEWNTVALYSSRSDKISFQIRLYETSNRIEIVYGSHIGGGSSDSSSIGVEDSIGSIGVSYSCTPACQFLDVPSGSLLTFTPSAGPPPAQPDLQITSGGPLPSQVTAGGSYPLNYTLRNNGAVSADTEVYVLVGVQSPVTAANGQILEEDFVPIGASTSSPRSINISIPAGTPNGTYFLALIADPSNSVTESDESNNVFQLGSVSVGTAPNGSITVTTTNLPRARVGSSYNFQLAQSGGVSPTWTVVSGSPPSGINVSSNGVLSGTPFSEGSFGFRVEASEPGFAPGGADLVLTVSPQGGLAVGVQTPNGLTNELPQGVVGRMYSATIGAEGGQAPYALQIVSGAPSWLTMNSQGQMSGTPPEPGRFEINVSVFDSQTNFSDATVSLEVIEGGPLMIESTSLPNAVTNTAYNAALVARGGFSPYRWTVNSGSLPAGLSLDQDGRISGSATSAGRSSFEVQVTDSESAMVTRMFEINVEERRALVSRVPERITLPFDHPADFQLQAEGGVAPYSWTLFGGALPPGIVLAGDRLQGTATSSNTESVVTLNVTDSMGESINVMTTIFIGGGSENQQQRAGRGVDRGCGCATTQNTSSASLWMIVALAIAASLVRRSVGRKGSWPRFTIRHSRAGRRSSPH